MTTTLLHIAGPLLILTSVASAVIAHLPLPPSTRSYYKHTAWEMLAIAFIAATMAQMPHPAGVTITVAVTIYSLTKSTEHYNTWQTLRAPHQ